MLFKVQSLTMYQTPGALQSPKFDSLLFLKRKKLETLQDLNIWIEIFLTQAGFEPLTSRVAVQDGNL